MVMVNLLFLQSAKAIDQDQNSVFINQIGNDLNLNLNQTGYNNNIEIDTDTNSNNISVDQTGSGHDVILNLYGTQPNNVSVSQSSTTPQSYSIETYCITIGGCSISVDQQ